MSVFTSGVFAGVEAAAQNTPQILTNWAAQANGGTATASATLDTGDGRNWLVSNSNDGNRLFPSGNWSDGGIFHGPQSLPTTVEYQFAGTKSITQINVFNVRDSFSDKSDLTQTETFSAYGNTAFSIDYWNGTAWVSIASVTNNKVWRNFTFAPISTNKVRIVITASGDGYGRLMEFEALG